MRAVVYPLVLGSFLACNKPAAPPQPRGEPGRASLESEAPNAPAQKPAFSGQTRAPAAPSNVKVAVTTIASELEHPWGLAFLPDGRFLVTERPGRLQIVERDGKRRAVAGVPKVDARDQGGLLDVVLDGNDVYLTYAEPRERGNGTALARARLVTEDEPRLDDVRVIWRMTPTLDSKMHFGARIVPTRDGHLFVTLGERSIMEGRMQAQKLDSAFGKIVRLTRDGAPAKDNPFVRRNGALPEIWSYGHRNIQAAALHPETGELWVVDHGPRGGDEINVARAGKDYGWPTITYGIEYKGDKVGAGITQQQGMEQPLYYWDPVIAPSGAAFYTGDLFPAWRGNLLVGGLASKHVARLVLEGERVIGEERLLEGRARMRDVRVGPDGAIYLLTDEQDGELLRIGPEA